MPPLLSPTIVEVPALKVKFVVVVAPTIAPLPLNVTVLDPRLIALTLLLVDAKPLAVTL